MEIRLCEGRALAGSRDIPLSNGEFAVASAMAMYCRAERRETWCDRLWPDRDADAAARLLKVYVHRIRAKFGANDVIVTEGGDYRLNRAVRVDVHSLATLARERSVGLIQLDAGQLRNVQRAFEGITERRYRRLARLEPYAEWERRFVTTGIDLGSILVDEALRLGELDRAAAIAAAVAALDPYDEVAAEVLIRAHVRSGDREKAERSYRVFCRGLRDELDLPPPRRLAALFES
jgi:DNA-binding SARP family transcriptional activator